jgi:hypothetical protein
MSRFKFININGTKGKAISAGLRIRQLILPSQSIYSLNTSFTLPGLLGSRPVSTLLLIDMLHSHLMQSHDSNWTFLDVPGLDNARSG